MRREHTYSMRMTSSMREDLQIAAKEKRSSVASLLEEIISTYLARKGFSNDFPFLNERRRGPRARITLPCSTNTLDDSRKREIRCVILNISQTGALITYPKGSQVVQLTLGELSRFELCFEVPSTNESLRLECATCHIRDAGAEIHLGARFDEPEPECLSNLANWLNGYG